MDEKKENKMTSPSEMSFTILCVIVLALLVVHVPTIVLDLIVGVEFIGCIAFLVYVLTKHSKETTRLALMLILFMLAVNIHFTKIALLRCIEDNLQIPIILFLSNLFCYESFVSGIISITVLLAIAYIVVIKVSKRIVASAERALNLTSKDKKDFWSDIGGVAKIIVDITNATTFLVISSIAGGIGIGKFTHGKNWQDAIDIAIKSTSGNILLFVIPLLLITVTIDIFVHRYEK